MIPNELKQRDQWVVWRKKSAPKSPRTGRKQWNKNAVPYDEAATYCNDNMDHRLGFVFQKGDGLVGFDLDGCRDPETGRIEQWAERIIRRIDSYAEVSQSGTGVKIIASTAHGLNGPRAYMVDVEAEGATSHGDHEPQVEIYLGSKYFALTGNWIDGLLEVKDVYLSDIEAMLEKLVKVEKPAAEEPPVEQRLEMFDSSEIAEMRADQTYQDAFNRENRISTLLMAKDWTTVSGTDHLKRPGKTDDGVSATINVGADGVERVTVWTTNGGGLMRSDPGGKAITYDAWSVYAHLYYAGDFSAAKRSFLSARPDLDPNRSESPEIEFAEPVVWTDGAKAMAEEPMIEKRPKPKVEFDPFALDRAEAIDDVLNGPIGTPVGQIPKDRELRPAIVEGICREGEVVNLISASKIGKSFLIHDLAFAVAAGETWLDSFRIPKARRVLILDNELHTETIEWRLRSIGESRGADMATVAIDYNSMRGRCPSIFALPRLLNRIEPETYGLIILDAFYRFLPEGTNENDNGQMTQVYNALDSMVSRLRAAVVLVHHTSKGDQSQKSKVDVGSGAGAMARAADAHIIIRNHESPGMAVLEGEARSFKAPDAMSIERIDGGLRWVRSSAAPVVRKPGRQAVEGAEEGLKSEIFAYLQKENEPKTVSHIANKSPIKIGEPKAKELMTAMVEAGELSAQKGPRNGTYYEVSPTIADAFI